MNKLIQVYRYISYFFCRYINYRFYKNHNINFDCTLTKVSRRKEFYFGYYNLSPENKTGSIIFCDLSKPRGKEIPVILNKEGREYEIGTTAAFNLQQGCMAQWGYSNDNLIYYNRYNKITNAYECIIYNTDLMQECDILPMPIYALSKQEDYALSLNFERLSEMRPDYGYFCRQEHDMPDNRNDGIWKIDMATKQTKLIITLQQLIDLNPAPSMEGARHKVNHIDINPDGSRFMFLHRWVGLQGRFMRLITADRDGKNLFILNGDKMTSHCCWNGINRIISFCHTERYGEAYVEFKDLSTEYRIISNALPHVDGHPTISPDRKWIVTDRYPEFHRFSELFLYNIETNKCFTVGRFYQPLKYFKTSRIDLHPKWSMLGDKIYFESGHSGYRRLYSINIHNIS